MAPEFEKLVTLITEARNESRAERKKCYGIEDKNYLDGEVEAYNYCLQMIKLVHGT